MTQIITLLSSALQAVPMTIVPFLFVMALIGYLSYKIYQEFKKVYQKVNADKLELTNRIGESERKLALTDDKTLMLSMKLEKIENNLEKINTTLVELSTTLKIMREERQNEHR